jgi:hypothetical protein
MFPFVCIVVTMESHRLPPDCYRERFTSPRGKRSYRTPDFLLRTACDFLQAAYRLSATAGAVGPLCGAELGSAADASAAVAAITRANGAGELAAQR